MDPTHQQGAPGAGGGSAGSLGTRLGQQRLSFQWGARMVCWFPSVFTSPGFCPCFPSGLSEQLACSPGVPEILLPTQCEQHAPVRLQLQHPQPLPPWLHPGAVLHRGPGTPVPVSHAPPSRWVVSKGGCPTSGASDILPPCPSRHELIRCRQRAGQGMLSSLGPCWPQCLSVGVIRGYCAARSGGRRGRHPPPAVSAGPM